MRAAPTATDESSLESEHEMTHYDDSALQLAAARALGFWDIPVTHRHTFLSDPTGAALLALLCNAGAKHNSDLYASKARLIRHAITLAGDWWATRHIYGDTYVADTVIYIQTELARFAYHVRHDDPLLRDVLATAPTSDRGWDGERLQDRTRELAVAWLAAQRI